MKKGEELLTLRDGTQMERRKIHTAMKQLLRLSETDLATFYRFLELADESEGDGSLITQETIHVLHSSLEGKYPDFRLTWPVKD